MRGAPSAHPRWRGAGTQGRHVTSPVASGDTRSGGFAIAASPPAPAEGPGLLPGRRAVASGAAALCLTGSSGAGCVPGLCVVGLCFGLVEWSSAVT